MLVGCCGFSAQSPALVGAASSGVRAANTAQFALCSLVMWQPRGRRAGQEHGVGEESPGKPVWSGEPLSCSGAADRAVTLRLWQLQCCSPWQTDDLNLSLAGKAPGGKTPRVNLEGRLLKHGVTRSLLQRNYLSTHKSVCKDSTETCLSD